MTLQVRLFGKVSIQPVMDLPAKALELLCYLLIHQDHAHTREALAELLWPEASIPLSQKYLRQTLWQLQSTLENQAAYDNSELLLLLNPGWVRINPADVCWVDVQVFEQTYAYCLDLPGQALNTQQAQALAEAVELYQGELLETWYQDWCIYERERLQLIYLAMLDKLMGYCEAQGYYDRGITYGQRILRRDPARESTYQQLMRLHYLAGDRTMALRTYARCVKALAREFNLAPTQLTDNLYTRIRNDQPAALPMAVDAHGVMPPDKTPTIGLHQKLAQLETNLATFQAQVQQELTVILDLLKAQVETRQQTPRKTRQSV